MDEPLNPVLIERETVGSLNSISESIRPVSDAYDEFKTAELEYKKAYALAFDAATGSVEDRKQKATLASMDEAFALKDADVLHKRMTDYQRMYRDKLSAFQSLSKSVNAAYGAVR